MKTIALIFVLSVVLFCARNSLAASTDATITINATVDAFAEWADPSPVVITSDWSGPLAKLKQQQTVTKTLVLKTNTNTIITPSAGSNNGVLTHHGHTLPTAYQILGSVTSPDHGFKPAEQFLNRGNTYQVEHNDGIGTYNIDLKVQASVPPDTAPDAGVYTCSVVLTATW